MQMGSVPGYPIVTPWLSPRVLASVWDGVDFMPEPAPAWAYTAGVREAGGTSRAVFLTSSSSPSRAASSSRARGSKLTLCGFLAEPWVLRLPFLAPGASVEAGQGARCSSPLSVKTERKGPRKTHEGTLGNNWVSNSLSNSQVCVY